MRGLDIEPQAPPQPLSFQQRGDNGVGSALQSLQQAGQFAQKQRGAKQAGGSGGATRPRRVFPNPAQAATLDSSLS